MMNLTPKQRKYLRAVAHSRRPVVTAGQRGLTSELLAEIDVALTRHELIKIKLNAAGRGERQEMTRRICEATSSDWIQNIGRVAVIYRPAEKPAIELPGGGRG